MDALRGAGAGRYTDSRFQFADGVAGELSASRLLAGAGGPFIVIGLAMGAAGPVLRGLNRHAGTMSTFSAVMLIAVGIMLLTGTLGRLMPVIS